MSNALVDSSIAKLVARVCETVKNNLMAFCLVIWSALTILAAARGTASDAGIVTSGTALSLVPSQDPLIMLFLDSRPPEFRLGLVHWEVQYASHAGGRTVLELAELLAYCTVNSPVKLLMDSRTVSGVLATGAEPGWARLVRERIAVRIVFILHTRGWANSASCCHVGLDHGRRSMLCKK